MKHFLTLFLCLVCFGRADAQKLQKFFYNSQWELTTRDSAKYIRMSVFDTLSNFFVGPVRDLFMTGKPQMSGHYNGKLKFGDFTFYFENGKVESAGRFEYNLRVGLWKYYHPNGKPRMEATFEGGDGKVHFVKDSTGNALPDPNKVAVINDLAVPSKFAATEKFVLAKGTTYEMYPFIKAPSQDEDDTENPVPDDPAQPEGGMASFYKVVANEIKYPVAARKAGVTGKVVVEFVVETDGSITELKVLMGIGSGCDEEALRVVEIAAKKHRWKVARYKNKPVKQRMLVPISFNVG